MASRVAPIGSRKVVAPRGVASVVSVPLISRTTAAGTVCASRGFVAASPTGVGQAGLARKEVLGAKGRARCMPSNVLRMVGVPTVACQARMPSTAVGTAVCTSTVAREAL